MSFRALGFDVVRTVSEGIGRDAGPSSVKRLREIVAGRDTTVPRSRGMAMLLRTDFPNKHRDFEAVLENESEPSALRHAAAMNLAMVATPAALEVLMSNTRARDELVLTGVMKALGRIGGRAALDAIADGMKHATGEAAKQASFAATLISHRISSDDRAPAPNPIFELIDLDRSCARPLGIARMDDADAELCLRSIARQPFGIEFAERPMYGLRCGRNTLAIVLNRLFAKAGVSPVKTQRTFLGVVATRSGTGLYFVSHLVLTAPSDVKDEIGIRIYRPGGSAVLAGTGKIADGGVAFSIRAVSQPGAFGMEIEGIFGDGRLDITRALSSAFAQVAKLQPVAYHDRQLDNRMQANVTSAVADSQIRRET